MNSDSAWSFKAQPHEIATDSRDDDFNSPAVFKFHDYGLVSLSAEYEHRGVLS